MQNLPSLAKEMDFNTYLRDPCEMPSLTSSLVRALLTTAPRKVWQETARLNPDAEDTNKKAYDIGSAAHRLFTGTGAPLVEIAADSYRSKDAQAQRDAAYAEGKTPILTKDAAIVRRIAQSALNQVRQNDDIGPLFGKGSKTLREASIFWKEAGVHCRCRPDFYDEASNTIIHYKTTAHSIAPAGLARVAAQAGWHFIAAHYGAGAKALTGAEPRQFFFVQEVDAPHLAIVAQVDPTFLEVAKMRRDRALTIWGRCLSENVWPAYPATTVLLECPEWHEREQTAAKDAENEAALNGRDLLEMARRWQAPVDWQPPAVPGAKRDERD